ncbi:S1 family peptidase [Paenibacillus sp. YPG26]|uniref:S1 family peptidase n=1 Tax=Paenibacillus sp. YPG26 TaxID=2878915 RepID=UPI002041921B|nr:S1 family peptidase [Paenibacillus sp. YPG26]USB31897.1 S1 family peptidase [Paenibacillus sp. YPG26]
MNGKKSEVPIVYKSTPRFRPHALARKSFTDKVRPIIAGYSIGTPAVSGTVGLIISSRTGRQKYIFSNNHVLNETNSSRYSVTLQPGGADGGTNPRNKVGRLDRFVKLSSTKANYIDAATSLPIRNSLLSPRYAKVGVLPGYVTSYRIGDKFKKVGRTTGLVSGTVDSIHTDVTISYEGYANLGNVTFKNQTVIKSQNPISLPGDSGSVWLTSRENYAAAVNYAGSSDGRLSIAYPVQWVMQVFNTTVARPNGTGVVKKIQVPARAKQQFIQPLTAKQLREIPSRRAKRN